MAYADSDPGSATAEDLLRIKILVAGGFGAGKTTLVSSVSEIRPLRTEEPVDQRSQLIDRRDGVEQKATTTVALDFGRITIQDNLCVYLFGTPGQHRFWFMWDELALGALGAIVIADTRRLADCFASVDYFERAGTPFVVAVNCFENAQRYPVAAIRSALGVDAGVPVISCDARQRASSRDVLIRLTEHVIGLHDDRGGRLVPPIAPNGPSPG